MIILKCEAMQWLQQQGVDPATAEHIFTMAYSPKHPTRRGRVVECAVSVLAAEVQSLRRMNALLTEQVKCAEFYHDLYKRIVDGREKPNVCTT